MIIADLYSSRIQKSFDEDQAEIVSILKANSSKVFKLINYYKGLPLSYPAKAASFDRGTVDFDVQAEQAFAIEQGRYAFIRSPLFKHDVFAQSQYVNIKKRAALFVKFSYVEVMAEHRNFIRLEPDLEAKSVVESAQGIIEGKLFDLSLSGVNISVNHYHAMTADIPAKIRFILRNSEQTLNLNVSAPVGLVHIKDDVSPYSYKFTINLDKQLETALSKYVFQRQIEIIREIKDAVN